MWRCYMRCYILLSNRAKKHLKRLRMRLEMSSSHGRGAEGGTLGKLFSRVYTLPSCIRRAPFLFTEHIV